MSMNRCLCGSTSLSSIQDTTEFQVDGEPVLVENIPAIQCAECHEIYYGPEASRYIDAMILPSS